MARFKSAKEMQHSAARDQLSRRQRSVGVSGAGNKNQVEKGGISTMILFSPMKDLIHMYTLLFERPLDKKARVRVE
jgi:hypothetical protein